MPGRLTLSFTMHLAEHFSLALTVEALWADIGRNRCVRKGDHFERKLQGEWGRRPSTTVGVRKLDSLGYHVALSAWSYVSPFWHNTGVWRTSDGHTTTANISVRRYIQRFHWGRQSRSTAIESTDLDDQHRFAVDGGRRRHGERFFTLCKWNW